MLRSIRLFQDALATSQTVPGAIGDVALSPPADEVRAVHLREARDVSARPQLREQGEQELLPRGGVAGVDPLDRRGLPCRLGSALGWWQKIQSPTISGSLSTGVR